MMVFVDSTLLSKFIKKRENKCILCIYLKENIDYAFLQKADDFSLSIHKLVQLSVFWCFKNFLILKIKIFLVIYSEY